MNIQETSLEALASVAPTADTKRRLVYDFIKSRGEHGATDDEIQQHFGDRRFMQTPPRRFELVEAGLVRDCGKRRTNSTGRKAIVWRAT